MKRTVSTAIGLVAASILTFGSLSPASASAEALSQKRQKIDLDGTGGPGVCPYDMKDSKHSHICKTIK